MSSTPWIVGGIVVAVGIVGYVWYRNNELANERLLALQNSGLSGLGDGVDQTRQTVNNVFSALGQLAGLGTEIAKGVNAANQQSRDQTGSARSTSRDTDSARSTGGSGKGLAS